MSQECTGRGLLHLDLFSSGVIECFVLYVQLCLGFMTCAANNPLEAFQYNRPESWQDVICITPYTEMFYNNETH